MVRLLALALLLVNLLYFGWAEWIDVPPPPQPSSIAHLPRLTLVSELPPAKRAALARKMFLETHPAVCVSVGPFDDAASATRAAELLRTKSFTPQQRAAESPDIRRFWVYLQGFSSDAALTRALHKLERGGIDDAEAMPPETGGRRISLGLFSDRVHADRRAKAVRTLGLEPRIDERMVPGTVYWLDVTLPDGSTSVPVKDVAGLEPDGGNAQISVQPCPPGAAAPTAPTAPTGSPVQAGPPPRTSSPAPPLLPAVGLPKCRPGGGGPVPCVASESRESSHPSVL